MSSAGDHIYVHGGSSDGKWQSALYQYTVSENRWTELAAMTAQRRRCASAAVDIYVTPRLEDGTSSKEILEEKENKRLKI